MNNILLIDIDHTLSDAAWRDNIIGVGTWDEYYLAGVKDDPVDEMITLVSSLGADGWWLIGLTARPEKWRKITMDWLVKHGVLLEEMLMRPDDDFHSAPDVKVASLRRRFGVDLEELKDKNVILIDDNDKVIEAMRGLNITTLQCSVRRRNI